MRAETGCGLAGFGAVEVMVTKNVVFFLPFSAFWSLSVPGHGAWSLKLGAESREGAPEAAEQMFFMG